jgi:WD40 repeat protein
MKKSLEIKAHNDWVEDIVWHPTRETQLVTTSKDRTVKIWDTNAKGSQALQVEKTKEENINLAISPDGNYLGV